MDSLPKKSTFDPTSASEQFDYRFKLAVELLIPGRGGLRALSRMTGIGYERWRNAVAGRSAPSIDMMLALADLKPDWAMWLMLGKVTPEQVTPPKSDLERAVRYNREKSAAKAQGPAGVGHPEPEEAWHQGMWPELENTIKLGADAAEAAKGVADEEAHPEQPNPQW